MPLLFISQIFLSIHIDYIYEIFQQTIDKYLEISVPATVLITRNTRVSWKLVKIRGIRVVLDTRQQWWLEGLVQQSIPVKSLEPFVLLDVHDSIFLISKSFNWILSTKSLHDQNSIPEKNTSYTKIIIVYLDEEAA